MNSSEPPHFVAHDIACSTVTSLSPVIGVLSASGSKAR